MKGKIMLALKKLYEILSLVRDQKKTGRVYVYIREKDTINCAWIVVKDGQVFDIIVQKTSKQTQANNFLTQPIKDIVFVPAQLTESEEQNPYTPSIDSLLKQIESGKSDTTTLSTAPIGRLLQLSNQINIIIDKKKLDRSTIRGRIGLKAGILMNITENTPDDPNKIEKLIQAANEVLGEKLQ